MNLSHLLPLEDDLYFFSHYLYYHSASRLYTFLQLTLLFSHLLCCNHSFSSILHNLSVLNPLDLHMSTNLPFAYLLCFRMLEHPFHSSSFGLHKYHNTYDPLSCLRYIASLDLHTISLLRIYIHPSHRYTATLTYYLLHHLLFHLPSSPSPPSPHPPPTSHTYHPHLVFYIPLRSQNCDSYCIHGLHRISHSYTTPSHFSPHSLSYSRLFLHLTFFFTLLTTFLTLHTLFYYLSYFNKKVFQFFFYFTIHLLPLTTTTFL